MTGGHSGTDNLGIKTAYLYDFEANSWTRGPDMQNGRWYPSVTTLASGELLTMSGGRHRAATKPHSRGVPAWRHDGNLEGPFQRLQEPPALPHAVCGS